MEVFPKISIMGGFGGKRAVIEYSEHFDVNVIV